MGFGYFMYSHSLVPVIDLWISGRDIKPFENQVSSFKSRLLEEISELSWQTCSLELEDAPVMDVLVERFQLVGEILSERRYSPQ